MESLDKDNLVDDCIPESNQNLSETNENVGHNQEEILPGNNQSTSSKENLLEENCSEEGKHFTTDVNCAEKKLEVNDTFQQIKSEECDTNTNANNANEQPETVSQDISEVTEKCGQYIASPEKEVESGQTTECGGEYVLEHTEHANAAEEPGNNINTSEQADSIKIMSDNVQTNDLPNQVDQQTTPSTEAVDKEVNETAWMSQYSTEDQVQDESVPQQSETFEQSDKHIVKDEYADVNTDTTNNLEETEIQSVRKSLTNEQPVEENLIENIEDSTTDNNDDKYKYLYVKEEQATGEVIASDHITNQQKQVDNINEITHEQVICPADENIENMDVASIPENVSESYTIAEGMEVTEIQEGEYTIVEGPSSLDISTTSHQEESGNSDGTLVVFQNYENFEENSLEETVIDEQHEEYINELRSEAESRQSVSSQASEYKPRRGRKCASDIPMHVRGHDISKPVETVPNGRTLPKPRLGVKVPYRNLTSQIVSKADIEKEVMERVRIKQEQTNSRADILFARKLTQRLARKIAPSPDPPKKLTESEKLNESHTQAERTEGESNENEGSENDSNQEQDNTKIHNDSDLLAILEGEGDEMPVLPKEIPQPQIDDSNLKMLEREIALQQLQDLPNQTPRHRILKGHHIKLDSKVPDLILEGSVSSKTKTGKSELRPNQTAIVKSTDKEGLHIVSEKENETTKRVSIEGLCVLPKENTATPETHSPKKQPIEVEPQVKVNMVLKTYSRKRKTTELPETLIETSSPKKTMLAETEARLEKVDTSISSNVYVTKSSRVIKKKVIWDPDEVPTRSPKSIVKVEPAKVIKHVEKGLASDKIAEKKSVNEKPVKEKTMEKKNNEKISQKKITSNEKKVIVTKSDTFKSKTPIKNKKSLSEVDKLLMDEGAVKMLYDLKNTEESASKKKKDVYSVEKAHKEIMKKANEIKSDLQQNINESPKSLRKKDAATSIPVKPAQMISSTERKMSKDSTRSSFHTPPASPAYSFPHAQSSMLVRRRSSSSISSSDEVDENGMAKISRKKSLTSSGEYPKLKKMKKNEVNEQLDKSADAIVTPVKAAIENKLRLYKSFTVKKSNKHVTVDLNYVNEKCYCTIQVLDELTAALKKFASDKDCHVVSITSSSKAFCLGLDYTFLISDEEEVRRANAIELAGKVREFLLRLLKFPKVLIAGIQGDCIGLGVTMLPLFDIVIASDTATFSTPYVRLGCMAEGGSLLSPPVFTNHGLASELLYTVQKVTADDAFRRGLVSRLCWPEKYNETLKNIVASVSRGSKQSLEANKKQLRRHLVQTAEAAINTEFEILVEHWISPECQTNFAQLNGSED